MWGWHMDSDWGWWMVVGWFWMVAFWGVVIWAIVTVVQRSGGDRGGRREDEDPLAILERRYARGEIDTEEFEKRRQGLHKA